MTSYICFDLDNTLYDHQQFVAGAYLDIAKKVERIYGIPSKDFYYNIFNKWEKLSSRCTHIFSDALKEHNIYSSEVELLLVETYRQHIPVMLSLYPNVEKGLSTLRNISCCLGLLTDGQPAVQRRKIKLLEIEKYFNAIIITGDYGKEFYKPHPKGFEELALKLGAQYKSLTYIGDNPFTDFKVPKKLGMVTIRILSGEYKDIPCNKDGIDFIFESTWDAIEWLVANDARIKEDV